MTFRIFVLNSCSNITFDVKVHNIYPIKVILFLISFKQIQNSVYCLLKL